MSRRSRSAELEVIGQKQARGYWKSTYALTHYNNTLTGIVHDHYGLFQSVAPLWMYFRRPPPKVHPKGLFRFDFGRNNRNEENLLTRR